MAAEPSGDSHDVVASSSLSSRSLSDGQGLLVAAVDAENQNTIVVGSVPVQDDGDMQRAADELLPLLPQGLHVVGSYTTASSPAWQPPSPPRGVPVVTATSTAAAYGPVWAVNGQQREAGLAPAPPAAAADGPAGDSSDTSALGIVAGYLALRVFVDIELCVQFAAPPSSSSGTNSSSSAAGAATSNGAAGAASAAPVPPLAAVAAAMQQLSAQLLSSPQRLAFAGGQLVPQVTPAEPVLLTAASRGSVQEVLGSAQAEAACGDPCLSLTVMQHTRPAVGRGSGSSGLPPAPLFEFEPCGSKQQQQLLVRVPLGLDVLCFAPARGDAAALPAALLAPALQRQLDAVHALLAEQAAAGQPLVPVRARHFKPPGLGFPVTVCYPLPPGASADALEAGLLPRRQALHRLLGLAGDVPMLRLANALAWGAGGDGEGERVGRTLRLRNVHDGLAPPGFGGQVHLVEGAYEYYHYMQDKFNDAGWGCAYRSLQTIVSWFRLQHYTTKPVPSHRQIQELLVAMGDKPASFVGSKQWIGAIELGFILDEHLGITCKVLRVDQGADIPSQARALAHHFATQGTPVMIGGGVLAYTLLGVAFDPDTGDAAFLILDPHYTGGEDLRAIRAGSWVGWKQLGDSAAAGGPLFVKDAFYNFLCPQRPRCV